MLVIEDEKRFEEMMAQSLENILKKHELERLNCKVYTKKDAARILGLSFNTVQKLINRGYLEMTEDGSYVTYASILKYNKIKNK
jgi:predicted transcriptional regulator of viral defense system